MRVITSSSASGTSSLGGRNSTVISEWFHLSKRAIQGVAAYPGSMPVEVGSHTPSGC